MNLNSLIAPENRNKVILACIFGFLAFAGHLNKFPWLPEPVQRTIELAGDFLSCVTFFAMNPQATPNSKP